MDRKDAINKLTELMDPLIAPSIADLATTRDTGMIEYDVIWQIFPPGEIVVGDVEGVDALFRVVGCHESETRSAWELMLKYVDWDGERCGLREMRNPYIFYYTGLRRVSSLTIHPLSFADDPEKIKEAARARGRRFQQLRGFKFLHYNGVKVGLDGETNKVVSWRVLFKMHAFRQSPNHSSFFSLDGWSCHYRRPCVLQEQRLRQA